jgi:hypothetical protein
MHAPNFLAQNDSSVIGPASFRFLASRRWSRRGQCLDERAEALQSSRKAQRRERADRSLASRSFRHVNSSAFRNLSPPRRRGKEEMFSPVRLASRKILLALYTESGRGRHAWPNHDRVAFSGTIPEHQPKQETEDGRRGGRGQRQPGSNLADEHINFTPCSRHRRHKIITDGPAAEAGCGNQPWESPEEVAFSITRKKGSKVACFTRPTISLPPPSPPPPPPPQPQPQPQPPKLIPLSPSFPVLLCSFSISVSLPLSPLPLLLFILLHSPFRPSIHILSTHLSPPSASPYPTPLASTCG